MTLEEVELFNALKVILALGPVHFCIWSSLDMTGHVEGRACVTLCAIMLQHI